MHPNLLAYDDHEVFGSEEDISVYREAKFKGARNRLRKLKVPVCPGTRKYAS